MRRYILSSGRRTRNQSTSRLAALGVKEARETEKDSGATPGAVIVSHTSARVDQMAIAHDASRLAFMATSISKRNEKIEEYEIYRVSLAGVTGEASPTRLTRNEALEANLEWAADNRHIFFQTELGSVEGKYEDPQPRLYWVDAGSGEVQRWFADYKGHVGRYTPMPDGSVLCACRIGTEVQVQSQSNPKAAIVKREGWAGTYEAPAAAS